MFERFPVIREAQEQSYEAEADLIEAEPKPREEQRLEDRIEWIELPFVIHHRQRAGEKDLVLPAQLFDQAQHVFVAGKPVVVELLYRPVPVRLPEPRCQSAYEIGGFVNRYVVACLF